jgi:hypothetical protein
MISGIGGFGQNFRIRGVNATEKATEMLRRATSALGERSMRCSTAF